MSANAPEVHRFARANRNRFVRELKDFVRIPSVSADPTRAADVKRCAEWLARHLREIGLQRVRVFQTPRHPIVYAEWRDTPPGSPTLLIYGHYDVQPADPLNEWRRPPFEPAVVGDDLFGRGACDDKGQMFVHVKAIEAYLKTAGRLPVNVKCLFEGEEEIGSTHLDAFVARNANPLSADAAVVSDMKILAPDRPAITFAVRGELGLELTVTGQGGDLHSGNFGGALHNPLQALCEIIASFHDAAGRIAIPGMHDAVRRVSDAERERTRRDGPTDAQFLKDAGAARGGWGERGYSLYERTTIRPALTINGVTGGYQGPGAKAVLPARASAKVSFRLVPRQDPDEIERLFRAHVGRVTPPTVRVTVRRTLASRPSVVDRRHPAMRAAAEAYRRGFGRSPAFLRLGGSIPIVETFSRLLKIPTVLMGFALADDAIHGPNEKFHLPNFFNGITTSVEFLSLFAREPRGQRGGAVEHLAGRADSLTDRSRY